jgi:hypothetical protein
VWDGSKRTGECRMANAVEFLARWTVRYINGRRSEGVHSRRIAKTQGS